MEALIGLLIEWLADRPDLRRMFSLWIRATLMRKPNYGILLPQVDDLQEIKVMLADRLEQWVLAYIAALTHNPMRPENQSIQHIALLQEKFHCTSI